MERGAEPFAAGRDVVLLDAHRMGIADDGIYPGKKIAGNFEVGDQMDEPPKEQPVVVDQAPPKLPPLEDKPPEHGIQVDFEGVGDVYGPKQ